GLIAAPIALRRGSAEARPFLVCWLAAWALIMVLKEPVLLPRLFRWAKEDQFVSPLLCLLIAGAIAALPRPWLRRAVAAAVVAGAGEGVGTLVTNSEGGLSVLRACHERGVRRMVLASTSDCYGRNPDVPYSEESASVIGPPQVRRWSYAISKMFEEQALFAFR